VKRTSSITENSAGTEVNRCDSYGSKLGLPAPESD